ncbi:amidohydrolase family protein [Desulfatirhabdium butyrativorans]|uniref:amidohydrolase family protein n=1 Tax=Desulfatirhabdium butyrativorans TaxID=340467 RepID=UPI00040C7D7A|nr:amidohydrolase [Desulfatirhabdium butyrativorans]
MDLLIQHATVVTMDAALTIIEDGSIGVQGSRIAYLGSSASEVNSPAAKTIDARGCIVMPGLINAHTHAAMTLFRGLADDLPLMDWLNHYIFPVEAKMDAEFVHIGTMLACAEMILSGTTTFCDMYLFEQEAAMAAATAGIRTLVGEVLYDFNSPSYGAIDKGFIYTQELIDTWKAHPLVSVAVEPHSLYTCSPDLLKEANAIALRNGVPLILHVAETLSELGTINERYGKKPFEHMEALGICGDHVIADHCTHLDREEMARIRHYGIRVVTNPESNMKLVSGIGPIPELIEQGTIVGLGTDGAASNNDLDMFSEMNTLAKVHKISRRDPTVMDAVTVLRCATSESARSLGMADRIGSLEVGKRADLIVIDTDKPHLTPMYNPYSHLVYCVGGSDVIHSVIDGKLVMENRRLLTLDVERLMAEANRQAKRVRGWVGE